MLRRCIWRLRLTLAQVGLPSGKRRRAPAVQDAGARFFDQHTGNSRYDANRLLMLQHGADTFQPLQVTGRVLEGWLRWATAHRVRRSIFCHRTIMPFVNLGMPIRESDPAGVIMIRGRTINPIRVCRLTDKKRVVHAPRILVDKNPEVDGTRVNQTRVRVEINHRHSTPRCNWRQPTVHGHAANMRISHTTGSDAEGIRRTFVNALISSIGKKQALSNPPSAHIGAGCVRVRTEKSRRQILPSRTPLGIVSCVDVSWIFPGCWDTPPLGTSLSELSPVYIFQAVTSCFRLLTQ